MIELGHDLMEGLDIGMMDYFHTLSATMSDIMGHTIGQAHVGASVTHPSTGFGGGDDVRYATFGPIEIHNGMDIAMLKALIKQEMSHAL
jgi:hypothetical protein